MRLRNMKHSFILGFACVHSHFLPKHDCLINLNVLFYHHHLEMLRII